VVKGKGIRRFLLMSANGVKVPGTPYQETKKRAEDYLLASGLDATVFRPSVIFGDPKGKMEIATQLYRDVVRPPVPAPGFTTSAGHVRMSPVHVEDVADAFVNALADDSTFGKTYELGGPEVLSWSDMIGRVAKAAGTDKWVLPVPVGLMKIGATLFDWLPFFPVTRDQLTMLAEGNTAEPSIIESLIERPPKAFTLSLSSRWHRLDRRGSEDLPGRQAPEELHLPGPGRSSAEQPGGRRICGRNAGSLG
jgi:NADH dehydrogenase